MRKAFIGASLCLIALSCTVEPVDREQRVASVKGDYFYATFESSGERDTKVYLDENIKVLWNEKDEISIFNRKDANDEYVFDGETGDNAGGFYLAKDFSEEGVSIDHIYAVYPYSASTSVSIDGILSLTLPSEQPYAENSFGLGMNTMVSASDDQNLLFRNLCGYLELKFYGEGVSVSSVKLEGHGGQKLSGGANVRMEVGGTPSVAMADDAGTSITVVCDTPVELGTSKEDAVVFWMVVPPTGFTDGFKLTVTDSEGGVFVKETSKNFTIARNKVLRISAIEVEISGSSSGTIDDGSGNEEGDEY